MPVVVLGCDKAKLLEVPLEVTVIVALAVACIPLSSVTVTLKEYVPVEETEEVGE